MFNLESSSPSGDWASYAANSPVTNLKDTYISSNPSKTWATTHPNNAWRFAAWLTSDIFVPEAETHRGRDCNEVFQEKHGQRHGLFMHQDGPTGVSHIVICHWHWPESPSSSTGSSDAQKRALHHTLAQQQCIARNLEGGNKGFEQWWCFKKANKKRLTGFIGANWSKWYFGNYIIIVTPFGLR